MSRLNSNSRKLSLFFVILFLGTFLMPLTRVNAQGGYEVKDYKIDINVNENASAYFAEKIDVNFMEYRHGIYRWITLPIKWKVKDANNNKTIYSSIKVDNIAVVSDPYKIENKIEHKIIKIGDKDKNIIGNKSYKLSYLTKLYEDKIDGYDQFYCNILPFYNEAPVENAEINIVMPKKFDKDNIKLIVGSAGDTFSNPKYEKQVDYEVKGKTIIVKTHGKLPPKVGITLAVKLPDGYFKDAMTNNLSVVLLYIICGFIALAVMALWYKYGRDAKVVKTVEFEPPEDITSAELGYIIDGHVDQKDIVSLLFYFAQQGYLDIRQEDKQEFTVIKKKELPPGSKRYEFAFFNGLFKGRNEVRLSELSGSFYDTSQLTGELIESEFESKGKRIFPSGVSFSRVAVSLLNIFGFGVIGLLSFFAFRRLWLLIGLGVIFTVFVLGMFFGIQAQDKYHSYTKKKTLLVNAISLGTMAISMIAMFFTVKIYFDKIILAVLVLAMMGTSYFSFRFMQSRTRYGTELFGKILGFKEFIRIAEKDRLEKMVESNPEYFYNVLPYAYVMGLSKKWCKKFEGITMEPPTWWIGSYGTRLDMFDVMIFYSMFNSCSRNFDSAMNIPISDGGFFSDGGGFSAGGGFGGGGMGSW